MTRRADFCQTWLWQIITYMIMVAPKLPLSILRTEYETSATGDWVTSKQADVGDCRQAESSDLGHGYFRGPDIGGRMKSGA